MYTSQPINFERRGGVQVHAPCPVRDLGSRRSGLAKIGGPHKGGKLNRQGAMNSMRITAQASAPCRRTGATPPPLAVMHFPAGPPRRAGLAPAPPTVGWGVKAQCPLTPVRAPASYIPPHPRPGNRHPNAEVPKYNHGALRPRAVHPSLTRAGPLAHAGPHGQARAPGMRIIGGPRDPHTTSSHMQLFITRPTRH